MNTISLVGRITKELEIKYTPTTNTPMCEFSLAVNRVGQEQADFINCQVWKAQAENLYKFQGKGSLIGVVGSLRVDQFQDKEGNNRYKTYVLVSNIEYLGTKKEENAQNNQNIVQNQHALEEDPFKLYPDEIDVTDQFLD